MPNPIFKCPRCNEEVRSLNFSVECSEWGNAYLSQTNGEIYIRDYDTDGTEWTDNMTYTCPHCYANVGLDELIVVPVVGDTPTATAPTETIANTLIDTQRPISRPFQPDSRSIEDVAFCQKCNELCAKSELNKEGICEACDVDEN